MKGQTFCISSERGVGENGIKDWIGICRYRCVVRYEEFEMSFTKSKLMVRIIITQHCRFGI